MTKNTNRWYEVVKRKVEPDVSEKVRAFKKDNNLTGVKIEPDTKRYYPYGNLAAHVIGFVGQDNKGLYGLEQRYDSYLTGSAGRIIRATDNRGTDMLFVNYEDYYDETKGDDMNLTIDATIQYYLEKHLQQAVEDYDVQNGAAAIAMEPQQRRHSRHGSRSATLDLNDYQKVSDKDQEAIDAETDPDKKAEMLSAAQTKQWRNKALSDTYEPARRSRSSRWPWRSKRAWSMKIRRFTAAAARTCSAVPIRSSAGKRPVTAARTSRRPSSTRATWRSCRSASSSARARSTSTPSVRLPEPDQ